MGLGRLYIRLLQRSTGNGMLSRQTAIIHFLVLYFSVLQGKKVVQFSSKQASFPEALIMPTSVTRCLFRTILYHFGKRFWNYFQFSKSNFEHINQLWQNNCVDTINLLYFWRGTSSSILAISLSHSGIDSLSSAMQTRLYGRWEHCLTMHSNSTFYNTVLMKNNASYCVLIFHTGILFRS